MRSAKRNADREPRFSNFVFRVSAAAKGCQSKPDVSPRNPLKTNAPYLKRVSIFCDVQERVPQISTRQCCRIEFAATHSKQTTRARVTRQFFDRNGSQVDGKSSLGDPYTNPNFEFPVSIFGSRCPAWHAYVRRDVMYIARGQSDQDCHPERVRRGERPRDLLFSCAAAHAARGANDIFA